MKSIQVWLIIHRRA